MAIVERDIADPEVMRLFPAHGWALNSQGIKILWCPLKRLLTWPQTNIIRRNPGRETSSVDVYDAAAFSETLRKMVTTLRELHRVTRISCDRPCNTEPKTLTADQEASELVPLYIDLAIVYLRRIADRLTVACRPLLFEHWQSVPRDFKNWITEPEKLRRHKPICDFEILRQAIEDHSEWFEILRSTNPKTGKKGIRDSLEHRMTYLVVGKQQINEEGPHYTAEVASKSQDVDNQLNIISLISKSVDGLCKLMTGIHSAIGEGVQYDWGDSIFMTGVDDDGVGYWPQIGTTPHDMTI